MRKARIKGALVGVESVTAEGLKSVFKDFNSAGDDLATRLSTFKEHGVHVLGSFIFGLSSDRAGYVRGDRGLGQAGQPDLRAIRDDDALSRHGGLRSMGEEHERERSSRGRSSHHSLLADSRERARPKMFTPHETMTTEEIRERTQGVWDSFYSLREVWERSKCVPTLARTAGVSVHLQVVSPDVREHRDFDGQRPAAKGDASGALAGGAVPQVIRSETDAGARNADHRESSGVNVN